MMCNKTDEARFSAENSENANHRDHYHHHSHDHMQNRSQRRLIIAAVITGLFMTVEVPGIISIDHFHIWTLNADRPLVILEAYIDRNVTIEEVNIQIKARLHEAFDIDHATVDVMYPLMAPILKHRL